MLKYVAAGAALLAGAEAHMCAFQPLQRGGAAGAGSPHVDICAQTTGPCPVTTPGNPVAVYVPGEKIQVVLQKNLDHYAASSPGNFSVYLWNSTGSIFWGSVGDTPAPTLSLYTLNLVVPTNIPGGNYVVQSIYSTDNSQAPAAFYQCSDVTILGPSNEEEIAKAAQHNCTHHAH